MTTLRPVTDALDVTCPDHWHCDPTLSPHACARPDRAESCPTCGETPRPVTGPDGDNPITDEQIRELLYDGLDRGDRVLVRLAKIALGEWHGAGRWKPGEDGAYADQAAEARARCAAAYNGAVMARYKLRITDSPGQPARIYEPERDGNDRDATIEEAESWADNGPIGGEVWVIDTEIDHPDRSVIHVARRDR